MRGVRVYLDHNASAPLRPEARDAMLGAMALTGNPSSVHNEGRAVRALIDGAREEVAALAGASPSQVIFTSGATEANNWVLRADRWGRIYLPAIEHESIAAPAAETGAEVVEIGAAADGVTDVGALAAHVLCRMPSTGRTLCLLQLANNETGVIQPVADVAAFAREHGLWLHCDAVQAAGRLPIDFGQWGLSSLALSSHKLGGPSGVGALIVDKDFPLKPFVLGGGQERRRRAGTENAIGIAGFGAAAAAARREAVATSRIAGLRDRLEREIRTSTPDAVIIGTAATRLCNTSAIALPGRGSETMVIKLDLKGLSVSAGAACSSGKVGASRTLAAMGLPPQIARGVVRVSLGWNTSEGDVDAFIVAWRDVARGEHVRAAS